MTRKFFAKVCQANNLMEELAALGEFENDVVILSRFRKFDEFDDVWMIKLTHDLYFFQDVGAL